MSGLSVFDHPWHSGLLGDDEMQAIWSADRQLQHMLTFEAAWTRALAAAGTIDALRAETLAPLIEAFEPDFEDLRAGTAKDGLPIPALVRQLKAALGDLGVHTGSTSQDVIDTALVFAMRDTLDVGEARLNRLMSALDNLQGTYGQSPLMGRTRMQAATKITVGDRIAAWASPLPAHVERIDQMRNRVLTVPVGGASGDRAAFRAQNTTIVAALEETLALPVADKAWHTGRDGVVEFASNLSLITGSLGKIGQDLCLMAQQGIDEVKIAGGGGSSAMPHKQNPILAELLVTLARFNATQVSGMHHAMVHEQERSGAAWALEWMILPQMTMATGRALTACTDVVGAIEHIGTRE